MKQIFSISIGIMLFCMGCSKSDSSTPSNNNNNGGTNTPTYYCTFKVDGVAKDLKALTAVVDDTLKPTQMYLVASLANLVKPTLSFTLNKPAAGWKDGITYKLDEKDLNTYVEYTNEGGYVFRSVATPNTGGLTLTLTKCSVVKNAVIEGTFSGSLQLAENATTVQITEGKLKMQMIN